MRDSSELYSSKVTSDQIKVLDKEGDSTKRLGDDGLNYSECSDSPMRTSTHITTSDEGRNSLQRITKHVITAAKFPTNWPTVVSCEMNIPEWKDALRKAGLLDKYSDVIHGFESGFDQGIPNHTLRDLPYYTPDNHTSSKMVSDKIEQNLKEEVGRGRIYGPFTHQQMSRVYPFYRSNPLGAVVNGDGAIRPINNLSYPRNVEGVPSVNSFVNKNKFITTWDDFGRVATFFRSSKSLWLLALFDWQKAYRQIPTLMEQWKYLLVKDFNNFLYIDTRITFGGVAGCGSFGRPANAWKDLMLAENDIVTIFRWVDDNLFVKRFDSSTDMKDIVHRSKTLGVQTNEKKLSEFKHEQKFIGFIWNGMNKTVRLPENKLMERISQIDEVLAGESFSYNQIEVFVGRLTHVSYLLPQLRCYLCGLYRMKKDWQRSLAKRKIPDDVREDLTFWKETLSTFKHLRLIASPEPVDIAWVGDASTSYGIGVLVGKPWTQFRTTSAWDAADIECKHINYLETAAVHIGLLMTLQLSNRAGSHLVVWTDNTTTQAAITNQKSRSRAVNEEWKSIQRLLIYSQLEISAKRVTSEDNDADALSRGLKGTCLEVPRLHIQLPDHLSRFFVSSELSTVSSQ